MNRIKFLIAAILVSPILFCMPYLSVDREVTFNLKNPCDSDVLRDEGCQFLRLVISSTEPGDPLYPGNSPGPLARECLIDQGECSITAGELAGGPRRIDVLCYTERDDDPKARALSGVILPRAGSDAPYQNNVDLLLGKVNGFIHTTVLDRDSPDLYHCSMLGQDGGRFGHTATLLDDGRVLIVGGVRRIGQVEEILTTVEIYDPRTGIHRLLLNSVGSPLSMNATPGRAFHTATLLRDGSVLIAGGVGLVQNKWESLRTSEVFDPATETFPTELIGVTSRARAHHTATRLTGTGRVLLIGGAMYAEGNVINYHDSAEYYDPATNSWSSSQNSMSTPRAFHQATELDPNAYGGKVLVTGGTSVTGPLRTVEMYNPAANEFYRNPDPVMAVNRARHCAVRLPNGEVLVAGGTTTNDVGGVHAGVEVYSSSLGTFGGFKQMTLNLATARMDHTCTLLESSGDVLVAGGLTASGQATGTGELIDIGDGVYSVEALNDPLEPARFHHTATPFCGGWVLITGGIPSTDPDSQAINESSLFVPLSNEWDPSKGTCFHQRLALSAKSPLTVKWPAP
jgi:hypothetical protein